MNNPLVYQAIGVLLVLFFIFLLVMCWKTWRITHILFSFFVFAAAVTFLVFASFVLKTHAAWRAHYVAHQEALAEVIAENEMLRNGSLDAVHQTEDSIRSLRAELKDLGVDRGRVWPECRPAQQISPTTFRISTVPASLPQNEEPVPNGIQPQSVLYAFTEKENEDGWKVPAVYLGQFVAEEVSAAEVTLKSLARQLDPEQAQAAGQPNTTWALYEVLPVDSHEAFAEWDEEKKRMVGMDKEQLAKYIPNLFNVPQAQYDQVLDRFARFNSEATDQDPPENIWVLVEFDKAHEIQVDSEIEQSLFEDGAKFFDASGRAQDLRLRSGENGTVSFQAGDMAIFDQETADVLINDGVCKESKRLYRRTLDDFAFYFRDAIDRHVTLDIQISRAQRDAAIAVAMRAKAEQQLAIWQQEKTKLDQDLDGFTKELQEVTAYYQTLEARWQQTIARLSELFRANVDMANRLTVKQQELARQINARTASAAPATAAP